MLKHRQISLSLRNGSVETTLSRTASGTEYPIVFPDDLPSTATALVKIATTTGQLDFDTTVDDTKVTTTNIWSASKLATELAALQTTTIAEGTNLYYTDARFDARFDDKTHATTQITSVSDLKVSEKKGDSDPYTVIAATNITPVSGTYFIAFSTNVKGEGSGVLAISGINQSHTERDFDVKKDTPFALQSIEVLDGTQPIQINVKASKKHITISNFTFSLIRLGK